MTAVDEGRTLEIIGTHQGRIVALAGGQLFAATTRDLLSALSTLIEYDRETVTVHGYRHIHLDESELNALLFAPRRIDLVELPNCQPWGARDSCDEAGINVIDGRPLCDAHTPNDELTERD